MRQKPNAMQNTNNINEMKASILHTTARKRPNRIIPGLVFALSFACNSATAVSIELGTATSFAVLAGSGITNTGPTTITGDIGTHPTPAITGFGSVTLIDGVNHADDAVTAQAKIDLVTGYNDAAGRPATINYAGGFDLVGLTLFPGVYNSPSSLFLTNTLTLDAQGDPDAVWIFQAGSTLITASDSSVNLINGGQACHVFWQVGSSATLGTDTDFMGNILALTSITLNTRATVEGRVLALNGAVTMDTNTITRSDCSSTAAVPETGSTLFLLGIGLMSMSGARRRLACSA